MEREKQPYVPPMTGAEALAMFGDRSLLTLEEQQDRLGKQVDQLSKDLVIKQEDSESDWEVVYKLENDLEEIRRVLAKTNQEIRKVAQDLGKKRGPLTLH